MDIAEGRFVLEPAVGDDPASVLDTGLLYRRPLPPGEWEVEVAHGGAALIDGSCADAGRLITVDDFMPKSLWKSTAGDLWVRDNSTGKANATSFTERLGKFIEFKASFNHSTVSAKMSLDCYELFWPRAANTRHLWSLAGVYAACGFSTYGSSPGKWAYDNIKKWTQYAHVQDGTKGQHFFKGRLAKHDGTGVEDPVEWYLPNPSVSTFALLDMLTRWCSAAVRDGGLRGKQRPLSVRLLLESLILSAARWGPAYLHLRFETDWQVTWPRRAPTREPDLRLELGADGKCAISGLQVGCADSHRRKVQVNWREFILREVPSESGMVERVDLLTVVCGVPRVAGLYKQIIYGIAQTMEARLHRSLKAPAPTNALSLGCVSLLDLLSRPRELGFQLLKRLLAGIEATKNHIRQGWVMDKANVGIQLCNTACILTNNISVVGAPQAAT